MRFAAAFAGAVVVVFSMLVTGLKVSGRFPAARSALTFHEVDVLSERERRDFAELREDAGPRALPALPELADIPPVSVRHRVRGFVQAEVAVDRAGKVIGVDIIEATPPGLYEQQAVAELRSRRYPPTVEGGVAVPSRHLEIVDFTVPERRDVQ